jgi:hypothetical protein
MTKPSTAAAQHLQCKSPSDESLLGRERLFEKHLFEALVE